MNGERKFVLLAVSLVILCITILYCLLFFVLWQYRILVAVSLLIVVLAGTFSVCIVAIRGTPNRQLQHYSYPPLKPDSQTNYSQPSYSWHDQYHQ
jgi:hypothetical protein